MRSPAVDYLGNEGPLSEVMDIDFPVSPVRSLVLQRIDDAAPTITWLTAAGRQYNRLLHLPEREPNHAVPGSEPLRIPTAMPWSTRPTVFRQWTISGMKARSNR